MRENFQKSIDLLFDIEGYISDDKNDLGGFTRYGISQKYHPDVNVPKLTKEQAIQIYLDEYWVPPGCDELEYPLDMCLFIQAVNVGVKKALSFLDNSKGLLDFFMLNLNHYCTRPEAQRKVFLTGWCNRLIKLWEAI
jgi:lysozyme family protein